MTSYGNLRRRELRAMPTYQYPQQVFVLAQPDVLVQAGPRLTTDDLSSTSFNGTHYGSPSLLLLQAGAQAYIESEKAADASSLQSATLAAQAAQNANTTAANAAAQLAFQKRLPLLILSVGGIGLLGLIFFLKKS